MTRLDLASISGVDARYKAALLVAAAKQLYRLEGKKMTPEKDQALCERYPKLYKDRKKDMRVTAMCWGFQHGDGWYDLIDRLSAKLEPLIEAYLASLTPEERAEAEEAGYVPCASTVKEKFGTLRFYMTCSTDEMRKVITAAEEESARICEDCGKPGELHIRGHSWYTTVCAACAEETAKKRGSCVSYASFKAARETAEAAEAAEAEVAPSNASEASE